MFNNISWAGYLYAASILLIIYYALVLLFYYRIELIDSFQRVKEGINGNSSGHESLLEQCAIDVMEAATEQCDHQLIRKLLLDLLSVMKEATAKHYHSEELLLTIQLKLQLHSNISNSILKDKISQFILTGCKVYCSVHLNVEEVRALWMK